MICALSSRASSVQKCHSVKDSGFRTVCDQRRRPRFGAMRPFLERKASLGACLGLASFFFPSSVLAAEIVLRTEPSNALSLPTWIIHVSSVLEWVTAMGLIWQYGDVSDNPRWKGMTWGMMPCLGGALCACTWHFFYNNPDLEFLVTLQSALTFLGNCTCGVAAYRIYNDGTSSNAS